MVLTFSLAGVHSLALFQQDAINTGNAKLLEVFIGITAFCFVVLAVVAIVVAIIAFKAQKAIMVHVLEIKAKALPILDKSNVLIADLTPHIKDITAKANVITGHVQEITAVAKDKAHEFSPTISQANVAVQDIIAKSKITFDDANAKVHEALGTAQTTFADANQTVVDTNLKTRQQIDRVNGMVSGVLDATVRLGQAIEHGIGAPGREIAGIVNGAKKTIDHLMQKTPAGGTVAQQKVSDLGAIWASKLADLFTKKTPTPYNRPTYRPAPVPPVKRFGSMANAAGSGLDAPLEPGVSSGTTGNGDPIIS